MMCMPILHHHDVTRGQLRPRENTEASANQSEDIPNSILHYHNPPFTIMGDSVVLCEGHFVLCMALYTDK